ncbi:MAG: NAD(P)H-dependent oxidoreductase subunit E [Candidatus Nanoarchaeia archaeon]|nr:NAD(P)H-dependent oxidoreductase subunit E [Candidatus Nanoarchaeia archaeon]
MVSEWLKNKLDKKNYGENDLIEILHSVQHKEGFISEENAHYIAESLNVNISRIYSVITFYTDFKLKKRGKNLIRVCLGTACSVMHNKKNVEFIKEYLNINEGETTPDNLFTFEAVNCLGTCSLAPVVEINGKIYGGVQPEMLKEHIDILKKKK